MTYNGSHFLKLGLCLVLVSISCSSASKATDSSLSSQNMSEAHAAVVASLRKWITVKSFRQRFTSTVGGAETSGTMEFVAPDRVHLVMNIAGEPFESITIGQTEYTKDDNGRWVKTVLDGPATASGHGHLFTNPKHIAQLADNVADVQLVNTETSDETAMKRYRFKHRLPGSADMFESEMWIGLVDGLPRKIETIYNFSSEGVRTSGKSSIVCSDYNSAITIELPSQ